MNPLPEPDRQRIIAWLRTLDVYALTGKTHRELFDHSYPTWARNGRAWERRLPEAGGTHVLPAIMWYQHVRRPGSTDSRPGVICRAILAHLDATAAPPAQRAAEPEAER